MEEFKALLKESGKLNKFYKIIQSTFQFLFYFFFGKEFDMFNDTKAYHETGYFVLRKTQEEIENMDKESLEGKLYHQMMNYLKQFVKIIPLPGFMVFDFILHKNKLYFLEINPRLGGSIYAMDKNMRCSYLDRAIGIYLKQFKMFKNLTLTNINTENYEFWKDLNKVKGNYERQLPKPQNMLAYNKLFSYPKKCKKYTEKLEREK